MISFGKNTYQSQHIGEKKKTLNDLKYFSVVLEFDIFLWLTFSSIEK